MAIKPVVDKAATFDLLDIRLGTVIAVTDAPDAPKQSYELTVDFGKFGIKTSVGRFTCHSPDELNGRQVFGVLNLPPRRIGDTVSEVLILGVQYPGQPSGEATLVTAAVRARNGSKLF